MLRNQICPKLCTALRSHAMQLLDESSVAWSWRGLRQRILTTTGQFRGIRAPEGRKTILAEMTPEIKRALSAVASAAIDRGMDPQSRLVELNYTASLPGAEGQGMHTDISPLIGREEHELGAELSPLNTCWVALQQVTADMGPTEIIPSSHETSFQFLQHRLEICDKLQQTSNTATYYTSDGEIDESMYTEQEKRLEAEAAATLESMIAHVTQRSVRAMTMETGDMVMMDTRYVHRICSTISCQIMWITSLSAAVPAL